MTVNPSRIREARLKANLSQDGLARAVGTSQRNIVRWEKGHNVPRSEFLAAIAKATGQNIEFFLREDDDTDDDQRVSMPDTLHKLAAGFTQLAESMESVA